MVLAPVIVFVGALIWFGILSEIHKLQSQRVSADIIDILKHEQVTSDRLQHLLRERGKRASEGVVEFVLDELHTEGCAISDPDPAVPESYHDVENPSRRWRLTRYYFDQEAAKHSSSELSTATAASG